MKIFFAFALGLAVLTIPSRAEMTSLSWSQLVDQTAQNFEDPFKELSVSTLADISAVVRLRNGLKNEVLSSDERDQLEARLKVKEQSLARDGVDIDHLLSQRWTVAEKRKKAAWATNSDLNDLEVVIRGYFLAGRGIDGQGLTAYLVPEAGMCSHKPPPPPNQLLRLELPPNTKIPNGLYAPVQLTGKLHLSPKDQSVHVVDGIVSMRSAWVVKVSEFIGLAVSKWSARDEKAAWPTTITIQ